MPGVMLMPGGFGSENSCREGPTRLNSATVGNNIISKDGKFG
jgi:hypothetical protein